MSKSKMRELEARLENQKCLIKSIMKEGNARKEDLALSREAHDVTKRDLALAHAEIIALKNREVDGAKKDAATFKEKEEAEVENGVLRDQNEAFVVLVGDLHRDLKAADLLVADLKADRDNIATLSHQYRNERDALKAKLEATVAESRADLERADTETVALRDRNGELLVHCERQERDLDLSTARLDEARRCIAAFGGRGEL